MTCGSDCDVRTFVGLEDDDVSEISVSSSKLTGLVCYTAPAERETCEEGRRGRGWGRGEACRLCYTAPAEREEEEGAGLMSLPWQWTTTLYRHSLLM